MIALFVTLWKYEMTSKHAGMQLRALRRKLSEDEIVAGGGGAVPAATLPASPEA